MSIWPCTKCRNGHVIEFIQRAVSCREGLWLAVFNHYVSFFLSTADFGDFNRYDSQEFLQKFALFPIVRIFIFYQHVTWKMLQLSLFVFKYQHCFKPDSVFAGLDPGWASPGRGHPESGSSLSVLQVSRCSQHQPACSVWINRQTALHTAQTWINIT